MPGEDAGGPRPPGLWTKFENKKLKILLDDEVKQEFDIVQVTGNPTWSNIHAKMKRDEIKNALIDLFEPLNYTWYYSISDRVFRCYDISNVKYFLDNKLDDLNSTMFIEEYFDCDDFAQVLEGQINLYYKGIALGTFFYKSADSNETWTHAVNIFCQKKKGKIDIYLIDPITKQIFEYDGTKINPLLVII